LPLETGTMKISHNWLKQYFTSDLTLSTQQIDDILTQTGLEVEGVEKLETIPGGLEGVVIGKVVDCEPHPNADKLKITKVNIGEEELSQIVCGAPNVDKGQTVVVATVGCTLHPVSGEAFKIKKSKIRGEVSLGMICAEDELGLGESHDGIIVLDKDIEPGTPAREVFDLGEDVCFEIGLTPNRTDAMGHIGVARDLKAAVNVADGKQTLATQAPDTVAALPTENPYPISISDAEGCPLYAGIALNNIQIGPSPEWMQNQLKTIGIQPKNNVVDITNYILHEFGHPLHAFDADKIGGGEIQVKTFPAGTKFTTLDGVERELNEEDLMIADNEKPMCLAGVLGGEFSGVSDSTTRVVIESAYFNPVRIRKSAKRHAINSDASFRFERGTDPGNVVPALKRAVYLLEKYASAKAESGANIVGQTSFPPQTIAYRWKRGNQLMGLDLSKDKCIQILKELEFTILDSTNDDLIHIEVPNYRVDVTREVDITEEILRTIGFNNIPIPEKLNASLSHNPPFSEELVKNKVSDMLVANGFNEAMCNSLTKSTFGNLKFNSINANSTIKLSNPLSSELDVMRQSLVPGLLDSIKRNLNFQQEKVHLFEFGNIFNRYGEEVVEESKLCVVQCGVAEKELWNTSQQNVGFYSLWKSISGLLGLLGLDSQTVQKDVSDDVFSEGCDIVIRKKKVGSIGLVHKALRKELGIKQDVFAADLNWSLLLEFAKTVKTEFKPLPKFPGSRRDLSLLLDKNVAFGDLRATFKKADNKILKEISLFDVYEGDKLPDNKKSYALSFYFQDPDKTLTDKVIEKTMAKIKHLAENQFSAELR